MYLNSNSNVVNFRKILLPAGTVISQVQLEMVPDLAVLITPFTSSIFCSHGAKFVSVMNEKITAVVDNQYNCSFLQRMQMNTLSAH